MRKFMRTPGVFPFVIVALLLPAGLAGGLEISGDFQLENIGFAAGRTSADTSFPGADLFWGGSLSFVHEISDSFSVEGGVTRDLILRNIVYSQFNYRTDYLSVGIGTLVGILNTAATPLKTGIATSLRLELPGAVFVSVRSDTSLGSDVSADGDYSIERTDVTLGFQVPNGLCSLDIGSSRFTEMVGALETVDSLTDYSLKIVVFEKNVPFRLHFLLSYQNLRKTFRDGVTNPNAGIDSFITGLGLDLDFSASFSMRAGASASIYSLGSGLLANVSDLGFEKPLLRAEAGFTLKLATQSNGGAPAS